MKLGEKQLVSKVAIDFVNEDKGGFVRVAPYGDAPQYDADGNEITQRFDEESARVLVERFKKNAAKLLSRLGFKSSGLPFYNGHPDFGKNSDEERDPNVYAEAVDLEARKDGLYAKIKRKPMLEKLKEALGDLQISPRWLCSRAFDGTMKPFELISFGLVKTGNLKGADFINENQRKEIKKMDEEQLKQLAKLLNLEDENATAEQVIAAITEVVNRNNGTTDEMEKKDKELSDAKNACESAKKEADDAKNACDKAMKEKEDKEKELDAANGKVAAYEKELSAVILDKAISEKRLTPAMRDSFEKTLAVDFANARKTIEALPVVEDFSNAVDDVIDNADEAAKQAQNAEFEKQKARKEFADLVNKKKGEDPETPYHVCVSMVSAANPELYNKCKF